MSSKTNTPKPISQPAWPTIVTVVGLVVFGPFVLMALDETFNIIPTTLIPLFGFSVWLGSFFVANVLFWHWSIYLLLCCVTLLCAIWTLFQKYGSFRKKSIALLNIVLVLVFMILPYNPAVQLKQENGKMLIPTAPTLPFRGLKLAQAMGEMHPCSYKILGWQNASLFYESTCFGTVQNWQYNIDDKRPAIAVDILSEERLQRNEAEHTEFVDLFQMSVHPPELESSVIELALRGGVVLSPNQEWAAIVAQHAVYGPEDILIIRIQANDQPSSHAQTRP